MFRRVLFDKYFIRVVIIVFFVELVTVTTMFMTMGHAGPEGAMGYFGWIALAMNTPGLALASLWGNQFDSILGVAIRVLVSQFLLLCFVAFLTRYFMLRTRVK
jgi:hypothetical protein